MIHQLTKTTVILPGQVTAGALDVDLNCLLANYSVRVATRRMHIHDAESENTFQVNYTYG